MISYFFRISILLFLLFFFSIDCFSQQKKELAKDILLATVNGEPITLFDVIANTAGEEKQLALVFSGEELEIERKKIRNEALDNIIDRKLVYAQFKKQGYKLPKQIIEKMLDKLAADLAGGNRKLLETRARKAGLTMDELKEQARERAASSILINERCFKNVYITPKQVFDYYKKNKAEFQESTQLKLQILYLKCNPSEKSFANFAEKLNKMLKDADEKKFAEYVILHSKGPNRDSGGDVGWIAENKLRKEFSSLLIGQEEGTIAGPIMTEEGYYFIRISERKEAKTRNFEDLKEEIREKLSEQKEEENYNSYIKRLKKDALIRIIEKPDQF